MQLLIIHRLRQHRVHTLCVSPKHIKYLFYLIRLAVFSQYEFQGVNRDGYGRQRSLQVMHHEGKLLETMALFARVLLVDEALDCQRCGVADDAVRDGSYIAREADTVLLA